MSEENRTLPRVHGIEVRKSAERLPLFVPVWQVSF